MSFWRLYYHLIWATQDREPLIQPGIEKRLYACLLQKAASLGVRVYAANGWSDHVHMVVAIPPRHSVADVVRELKGSSSHYLNTTGMDGSFHWQPGYGVLSLGERQRADAEEYVHRQKQHHQEHTDNRWLEYCADEEKGPTERGDDNASHRAREEEAGYDVGDSCSDVSQP